MKSRVTHEAPGQTTALPAALANINTRVLDDDAMRRAVDSDIYAACPSSNKWNRSTFRLSECFAHHFHVTRHAVGSANDVSRWSSS